MTNFETIDLHSLATITGGQQQQTPPPAQPAQSGPNFAPQQIQCNGLFNSCGTQTSTQTNGGVHTEIKVPVTVPGMPE